MRLSGNSSFLIDISKILILVEFGKFLKYRVDTDRNLGLVDPSGFPRFWFGVRVMYYRAFLLIIRGSKQKFEVILVDNHLM